MEIHRRAGAGRDDDRQLAGENIGGVARDFARGGPVAGVECRLAAASLVVGKLDAHAEVFEDFDGRLGGVVVEGVAKAGAHEEHAFVEGAGDWIGHVEKLSHKLRRG